MQPHSAQAPFPEPVPACVPQARTERLPSVLQPNIEPTALCPTAPPFQADEQSAQHAPASTPRHYVYWQDPDCPSSVSSPHCFDLDNSLNNLSAQDLSARDAELLFPGIFTRVDHPLW